MRTNAVCPTDAELAEFVEGGASPALREQIHRHIADCSNCAAVLAEFARVYESRAQRTGDALAPTLSSGGADPQGDTHDATPGGPAPARRLRLRGGFVVDDRYVFGEPFAAGGLGMVRRAEDRRLGRTIAVKELLRSDPVAKRRFLREAAITARLQHPGIVPLYDVGRHPDGDPFYCMKLVQGVTLEDAIRGHVGLSGRLTLLEHVIAASEAMAYAHQHHVIHRDLKPANILIGELGETVVIDWGLAKDLSGTIDADLDPAAALPEISRTELTVAGTVMGTLRYMPPEQACGEVVDARSDVFALGTVLHHVLAGTPPYAGVTGVELLVRVCKGEVEDLRALVPDAPQELLAIARKATAADPAARYPSARDFAEDLRRFLTGRLVGAHNYSPGEVLRRWLRRQRIPIAIGAAALLVLAIVGALAVQNVRHERDVAKAAESQAERAEGEARRQRERTRERLAETLLAQARDAVTDGSSVEALTAAAGALAIAEDPWARGALIAGRSGALHEMRWSALLADKPRNVVWNARMGVLVIEAERIERWTATGEPLAPITGLPAGATDVLAVAPGGEKLAVNGVGGVFLFEPEVRLDGPTLMLPTVSPMSVAWLDDDRLVSAGGELVVWQVSTGRRLGLLPGHDSYVRAVAARRDGGLVVSGSHDMTIRAWDPRTLAEVVPLEPQGVGAYSVDVSPDGTLAAASGEVSGGDGKVRVWELRTGRLIEAFPTSRGEVPLVRFSPDDRWLASSGRDATLKLWHRRTFVQAGALRRPGSRLARFDFSPDGAAVAVAWSEEPVLRVLSLEPDAGVPLPQSPEKAIHDVGWSSDGARLAYGSYGEIRVLDLESGALRVFTNTNTKSRFVGDRLLASGWDRVLTLLDPTSGAITARFPPETAQLGLLAGPGPGDRGVFGIISGVGARFVRLDDPTAELVAADCETLIPPQIINTRATWLPDGSAVLLPHAGILRVPADGSPCETIELPGLTANEVAASADGTLAAVAADEGLALFYIPAWTLRAELPGEQRTISALRFTPDGRWLLAADWLGQVSVYRVADGVLWARWQAHQNRIWAMELAPDGRKVATGSADRSARIWLLDPLEIERERAGEWVYERTGERPPQLDER